MWFLSQSDNCDFLYLRNTEEIFLHDRKKVSSFMFLFKLRFCCESGLPLTKLQREPISWCWSAFTCLSLTTIIFYLLQSKVYLFSVCEIFLKLAVVLIYADENMRRNPIIKSLEVKHCNFMIKGTVSVISNPIRQRFIGRRYSYYYSIF